MLGIMDYVLLYSVVLNLVLTVSAVPSVDVQPSPIATVTEGAVLWLTCTYDLDGGTLGQLQWSDKDGGTTATAIPTTTPPCSTLSPENYRIDCNLASNEVRLGILNPVHGDTYSCSFYLSDFTLIGPVSTQVSVVVPVPSVNFTTPVSDTVTVTPGGSHVYTCVTGSCRPPARIDWYKDGVNVTTQTGSVSSDGGNFVTTSSITLTGAKGDSQVTIQCRASNVDGMTPVQSGVKTFVVQWSPDGPPVISGYINTSILYVNETLSLSCRQQGGNPRSTLTWTGLCGGIPAIDGSTVTESVSTITVTVTKGYNQGTCVCVSTHPRPQAQDRSQVTFTVHYPPSVPVITLTPTHPWLEGESGTLTCSYTEGFPAHARIEWFRNGLQTGQSTPSISLTPLNKADNRAGYSCGVWNDFTDVKLTNMTSSVTYLNVEYKPLVTLNPTHLTVVESQTAQLTCDAEGNPTPTVEWLRGGTSVHTGQGTSVTLTLSDIDRSTTDNYTCRADGVSSVQGRQLITKRIVYLLVQYPPDIVVVAPPNVEEGDTDIRLICRTVGEPNTLTSQSWTQTIGQTLIADQFTYETTTPDKIILEEVSLYDTGTYTCSVSNGIADRQGQTLQSNSSVLNVKVAPKFNSSGQNHNFYSRLHEQVTIKIPFYSNPPVTSTDDL
ncbi:hemicentin-1-like, partial [Pecten maximus]|uniref:hemicentin-1-like n=1 Tax=Pecten maximus TaxID=6579 RepID=UPI0014586EF7